MESTTESRISPRVNGATRIETDDATVFRQTIAAAIIGAIVASAGFLIYSRLEEEQRESVRNSVLKFLEEKTREVRAQFKL
jgi:hypothetical protein